MFAVLDRQVHLSSNQMKLILAGSFGLILEFLDYFLIGFVLTFIAKPWQLTFGTSSVILLASGVGSMLGATFFGWLADRIGRRKVFISTIALFSASTGALIFTPESVTYGWIYLSAFRFLIGFGAGGLYCVDLPLIQEFVPTSRRGSISGLVTSAVPLGFLLGSVLVAFLAPSIGWRGLMAVCVGLSVVALLARVWIPESPRWLMQNGRAEEARSSIAWALDVNLASLPAATVESAAPSPKFRELFRYPKSVALSWISNLGMQTGYYGLTLWSPTLLVQILKVPPTQAAYYMIFVTAAALLGRISFSLLSEAIGRRLAGILCTAGATLMLVVAALLGGRLASSFIAFLAVLMSAYFFGEGGFAIVGPYSAEVWPMRLRATGMGASYGFGGIGKIIGPMGLALIIGTSVSASSGVSFENAFLYFAAWYALAAVAFIVFGIETKGRSIEAIESDLEVKPQRRSVGSEGRAVSQTGR
jgi:MFS transporter, putative metabolite:H+ symporter